MTKWNGAYWLVHRTARSQVLGPNSSLHVYKSIDGLSFTTSRRSRASLRLPAEGGIEFVIAKNHLAIRAMARPWIEFACGSAQTVGGGIVGLIGLTGYFVRED